MLRKLYKPTNLLILNSGWTRECLSCVIAASLSSAFIKGCARQAKCCPDRKQKKLKEQKRRQRQLRGNVAACRMGWKVAVMTK